MNSGNTDVREISEAIQLNVTNVERMIQQFIEHSMNDIVKDKKMNESLEIVNQKNDINEKRACYESYYDKFNETRRQLEEEKKSVDSIYQLIDVVISKLKEFIVTKTLISNAYDVNINNIGIIMNKIVYELKLLHYPDTKEMEIKVLNNQIIDPKLNIITECIKLYSNDAKLNRCNEFVKRNIDKLEEWSGSEYDRVLYDSDYDDKERFHFKFKISNQNKLFFIVIDEDNNVFGH